MPSTPTENVVAAATMQGRVMFEAIHAIEMPWMESVPAIRTPWRDAFFLFMNYVDTWLFPLIIIPIVWYGIDRRWGARLFFAIVLNAAACHALKEFFQQPRPCTINPEACLLHFTNSFGFPSGAAMSSILLPGLLIAAYPRPLTWIIGIIFGITLSFSRIYLGVHFPTDLLGGWIAGACILTFCLLLGPKLEKWILQEPLWQRIAAAVLVPLIPVALNPSGKTLSHSTVTIALGIGLCLVPDRFYRGFYTMQWSVRMLSAAVVSIVAIILSYWVPDQLQGWGWGKAAAYSVGCVLTGLWLSIGFISVYYYLFDRRKNHSNVIVA